MSIKNSISLYRQKHIVFIPKTDLQRLLVYVEDRESLKWKWTSYSDMFWYDLIAKIKQN